MEEDFPHKTLDDIIENELLKARRIFLSDAVESTTAKEIIRKLWYLELKEPGKPILFVINSPGGAVDSGFAIFDTVKMLSSPITTLITGLAASFGSILSLCASPKRRFATKNSRIMIHQPLIQGIVKGQATDLEIQAKEIQKTRDVLINMYVQATGKSYKEIERALDRDTWMSAEEAITFGLLDKVISNYNELKM